MRSKTEPDPNAALVYSDSFSGSASPLQAQTWHDFLDAIDRDRLYQSIEMASSLASSPIVCSVATQATQVARALAIRANADYYCDGHYWRVAACGATIELKARPTLTTPCSCDDGAAIRPVLGSSSWGGFGSAVGGAGLNCMAPAQTLSVTLE